MTAYTYRSFKGWTPEQKSIGDELAMIGIGAALVFTRIRAKLL